MVLPLHDTPAVGLGQHRQPPRVRDRGRLLRGRELDQQAGIIQLPHRGSGLGHRPAHRCDLGFGHVQLLGKAEGLGGHVVEFSDQIVGGRPGREVGPRVLQDPFDLVHRHAPILGVTYESLNSTKG